MQTTLSKMILLAGLYVSQAVPLGFFIIALPAILRRQGMALESLGMLGAVALPWLLKFLWAPLVDRHPLAGRGHYRGWILLLQLLCIASVLVLSQADPEEGLGLLLTAGAVFMLFSATQDIATDGLAVRIIEPAERGVANGIQVGGYYLGQILGGGVVLVLYQRVGWSGAVLSMAMILALPLLSVWMHREPAPADGADPASIGFATLKSFFLRPGVGTWVVVLLLFRTGEAMALAMANPMLVDRGLSLEEIGLILGLVGSAGALAGAVTAGALLGRMKRRGALVLFGLFQGGALLLYGLPAAGHAGRGTVLLVVAVAAAAGGMATAALYTGMMDRSDAAHPATDFTLQQSICAVGPMLGTMASGYIAAAVGYGLHFVLSALVTWSGVALVAARLRARDGLPEPLPLRTAEG